MRLLLNARNKVMCFFFTSRNRRLLLNARNHFVQFFRTFQSWFRRLLGVPRIRQHHITYERVRSHLVATNNSARERLVSNLKNAGKKEGWLEKMKYLLFIRPYTIYLAQIAIFIIFFIFSHFIPISVKKDSLFVQIFAFFSVIIYLIIPLFLVRITPKLEISLYRLWFSV